MRLTADQCRQILGVRAKGMTDEEIMQLHDALHAFASALIGKYIAAKSETDSAPDA